MMKRVFDIILSVSGLILLAPLIMGIAVMIKRKLGSPVLFKQVRPGLNGKPFVLYKFRTMTDKRDENGELLADHLRLTAFGQLLRKFSLDELPQLYNVLKGDMSIIGPRPLLMEYLPLYTEEQAKRHQVRPGITGLAQVNGRNAIDWEKKFDLDVWYVKHRTFWLDLKILYLTIINVFKSEGVNKDGYVTTERFSGTKPIVRSDNL
jgi:sugar transferase EpsL